MLNMQFTSIQRRLQIEKIMHAPCSGANQLIRRLKGGKIEENIKSIIRFMEIKLF